MVDKDTAPKRLIVVSDDREIRKAARRRRSRTWSCAQMIHALSASMSGNLTSMPYAHEGDVAPLDERQVELWMKQFGVKGDEADTNDLPWYDPDIDET